jgi:hypothetical protein
MKDSELSGIKHFPKLISSEFLSECTLRVLHYFRFQIV